MTRQDFAGCLAVLSAGVDRPIPKDQATVWYDLLGDLNPDAFRNAIKRVLLEREYPGLPPVGLIRRYATEAVHGVPIAPEHVFARVKDAVSRYGYIDPAGARKYLGDEIWSIVQGIGGWDRICDSPIDQRQSLFAQFRDAWTRQEDARQQHLRLPEDLRPPSRIRDGRAPHPAVRLLADSIEERTA